MLGERLGESSGKITGTRVLPSEGGRIKVEVSFQGQGQILGTPINDVGTYWQTVRPGGTLRGEGHVLMFTQDGAILDWMGGGVGRPTGPGYKASYGVYGYFDAAPEGLDRLLGVMTAIEYEVEEDGAYRWAMWEWTGAGVAEAAGASRR